MKTWIKRLVLLLALAAVVIVCAWLYRSQIPLADLPAYISEVGKELLADPGERSSTSPAERILAGLQACEDEIVLYGISEDELGDNFFRFLERHPELFWVVPGYSATQITYGRVTTCILKPSYAGSPDEIAEKRQVLEQETARVLGLLSDDMSDYDKALFLHDYLVDNTDYDTVAAQRISRESQDMTSFDSSTAYGCLVEHSAVCSGYSAAYQLLLQEAGIPCGRVRGTGLSDSHEWNYIQLDGDYYYVDVTWDNPVTEGEYALPGTHEYFAVTTQELLQTHTIESGQFVPTCDATGYDYYRYTGRYLDTYTFDAVRAMVEEHTGDRAVEIKFGSPQELDRAVYDLLENRAVFRIPAVGKSSNHVIHSTGSAGLVLQLAF